MGGAGGGTPPASSWTSGLTAENLEYVSAKGFKTTDDFATSYRNLEKLIGDKDKLLKIPGENAKPEEIEAFHSKLGKPSKADDYEVPVPAGMGEEFSKWAKGTFFELNLSKDQAKKLTEKWNEYQQNQATKFGEDYNTRVDQNLATLQKKWGQAYNQNVGIAKFATQKLGIKGATVDALEKALGGPAQVFELFHAIGSRMGEHNFVAADGGGGAGGFGQTLTPVQARQQIATLRKDKEFMKKYTSGDAEARKKMDHLHVMGAAG